MVIYYIYIIYIILVSFISKEIEDRVTQKRVLTFFLWLGLFLIMGLRAETVGNDLVRYIDHYQYVQFIDPYGTRTEIGYIYFLKVLDFFNVSRQGYVIIVSFLLSISYALLIYKYSKNIGFSFFLHLTIGLFALTMSGIRQSLAISAIMLAIHFAISRQLIFYLITVFVATLFHESAIVFFPAYLLFGRKLKSYKTILFFISLVAITILFNEFIFSWLSLLSPERYVLDYISNLDATGMNVLPIVFKLTLPVLIILLWQFQRLRLYDISRIDFAFFIVGVVSVVFTILSVNISILDRLSYYYFVGFIILIPNSVQQFKNNYDIRIVQFLTAIISILYFIMGTSGGILRIDEFKFFWQ